MGCCSSNNQNFSVPIQPPKPTYLMQAQSQIVQTEPSTKFMFMLGVTDSMKSLLLQFDPSTRALKQLPVPKNMQVYNYSSMICIGKERFLVAGGITGNLTQIVSDCYYLEPLKGKAMECPKMIRPRYTHISIYYDEYVYMFGGRQMGQDDQAIMKSCQRLSLLDNKWQQLPQMKVQRCTGFSLVWNKKIYVISGYTAEFLRTNTIEIFDPRTLKWNACPFELHQGIECGSIVATRPNEVVIFGGNMEYGPVNSVFALNLLEGTIQARPRMAVPRVLQKSIVYKNSILIMGGCEADNIEQCDLNTFSWTIHDEVGINKFVEPQKLDLFCFSQTSCFVPYNPQINPKKQFQYTDEIVFLFGTDAQPFILQFNISIPYVICHPVPLTMKCFGYQGGVSLPDGRIILAGGITQDLNHAVKDSFIFDTKSRKASKIDSMKNCRYAFPTVFCQDYVYAIGGRNENEEEEGLMNECQRLNIKSLKWENIASMPIKCVSCCAFNYKNHVYVTGGYERNQDRNMFIYVYDKSDVWRQLACKMPFGIEASALLWASQKELLFFGGRVHSGDIDGVWKMSITKENPKEIQEVVVAQVGKLNETKSLHKVYHPRHQEFAVIFGGSKQKASLYNLRNNKIEESDILRHIFDTFTDEISKLQDPTMKKYLLMS